MTETEDFRKKLLIELYNQLWNSINTRLSLIWESISILVGAFAIFALAEKNIISLDAASSIVVLIVAWFLAHVIDMSFWFNRNLAMIANIERQFLTIDDARLLYPYFVSHRTNNRMVYYQRIQASLGIGVALIVLALHLSHNVLPILKGSAAVTVDTFLPYLILILAIIYLWRLKSSRNKQYADFLKSSPGKDMGPDAAQAGQFQDWD